ncbi:hypothetical protein JHK82_041775 [Glycine max]|uniref:Uncharacterized protein n=2 Tax=Glycine subgen. Soja TaxID=1462606 RepID=K7MAE8_SOYBN|nr:hypothetical protein JHK87_041737 [Glycine soja]KAG4956064.1 hypothetical protein JHK85_042444 [Glycine max]KAG5104805.1 hypothetical protein JHK82_041775 [Glycine max]KAG5115931.1 hypothetical protein JHK84_042044 [Glycine max]KAH1146293.1 hypothetical protein GYH30_041790 [Glycine max]
MLACVLINSMKKTPSLACFSVFVPLQYHRFEHPFMNFIFQLNSIYKIMPLHSQL